MIIAVLAIAGGSVDSPFYDLNEWINEIRIEMTPENSVERADLIHTLTDEKMTEISDQILAGEIPIKSTQRLYKLLHYQIFITGEGEENTQGNNNSQGGLENALNQVENNPAGENSPANEQLIENINQNAGKVDEHFEFAKGNVRQPPVVFFDPVEFNSRPGVVEQNSMNVYWHFEGQQQTDKATIIEVDVIPGDFDHMTQIDILPKDITVENNQYVLQVDGDQFAEDETVTLRMKVQAGNQVVTVDEIVQVYHEPEPEPKGFLQLMQELLGIQ